MVCVHSECKRDTLCLTHCLGVIFINIAKCWRSTLGIVLNSIPVHNDCENSGNQTEDCLHPRIHVKVNIFYETRWSSL